MQYAEIFVRAKPWATDRVLVGLIAENPATGNVEIAENRSWMEWLTQVFGSGSVRRFADQAIANQETKGKKATAKFLSSLRRLSEVVNREDKPQKVEAILRCVPDRGTACIFSHVQSGSFGSVQEALDFCSGRELLRPELQPIYQKSAG